MLRPEHGDLPHQGEQTDDQRLLPEGEVADLLELERRQAEYERMARIVSES